MGAPPRGSASERAHEAIRESIVDGSYAPGTLLSENELAAALGVSRTPVRAALARLRDDGWITIYPQRGAVVNALGPEEILDIANARHVLETSGVAEVSREAALRIAEELRGILEQQRAAHRDQRVGDFIELSIRFHSRFVEAGGNRHLIDFSARLADRQRQLLYSQRGTLLARMPHLIEDHERLVDALRDRDADLFSRLLRQHLATTHPTV